MSSIVKWWATRTRTLVALVPLVLALVLVPTAASAQDCVDCLYAIAELNLRQKPNLEAEVLRWVPQGAAVQRLEGEEVDGYVPVTFDSVPGWVVALGLVTSPEEIDTTTEAVGGVDTTVVTPSVTSADARFTLEPLLLRGGPSVDAEPILTIPEGADVTLTREGAENGYVTVEYDGVTGWAYAELLGGDS
jgi:uncharacterized protein YgiM (DUF1202 family)